MGKAKAPFKSCRYWMYTSLVLFSVAISGILIVLALSCLLAYGALHPPNLTNIPAPPGLASSDALQLADHTDEVRVYKNVSFTTTDGLTLRGWHMPSQNGVTIVLCHGFARDRTELLPESSWLAEQGFGTLLPDLRAQGRSDGAYTSFGYLEALDVQAAVDYIRNRSPQERLGVIGYSMGAVAAMHAAARDDRIEAVIAVSPFASLRQVMHHRLQRLSFLAPLVGWWGERWTGLRLDDLNPLDDVAALSPRPVLIMQAESDGVVPLDSGRRLYEAAGEPRVLWSVPGVEHIRFRETLPKPYKTRVMDFFMRHLLENE